MRSGAFFNNMINHFFSNVKGQEKAKGNLLKIYRSGKIPHAFIFSGQEGIGKFNLAINFAVLLNCNPHVEKTDPSIEKKILQLQEPFVKYIIPLPRGKNETSDNSATEKLDPDTISIMREEIDKKISNPYHRISIPNANGIKISSIREIRKFLSYNFDEFKYRVILLSDANLMNDESQNALLKSLEEPPDGVVFILLTSRLSQLRDTIVSRCWRINCESLTQEMVQDILISRFNYENRIAEIASKFSNGSIYRAIDLINNNVNDLLGKAVKILRYSLALKHHSALNEVTELISGNNRERFLLLLNLISLWLNDALKNRINMKDYYFFDYADTLEKFNQRFANSEIAVIDSRINRLAASLENNVNLNVIALNLIFELASLRY